ncbi:unnamed protein product [Caenorhabditis brenneri]
MLITRYADPFKYCVKREAQLAKFQAEDKRKAMTEAALELNKQMGGGEASVWTYHDDNKEAVCEAKKRIKLPDHHHHFLAGYNCYQTKKMYACMKQFIIIKQRMYSE